MSWAALTSWATLALASNVCGSVLGLSRIEDAWTYLPPIWPSTLAYSFSAPMALITPALVEAELLVHPDAASAASAASAVVIAARHTSLLLMTANISLD
jgi:hypothetical protein